MSWTIVDEKIVKSNRGFQSGAQDVTVSGNGVSEVVVLVQGRNVVSVDPTQIATLYKRLVDNGAVKAA